MSIVLVVATCDIAIMKCDGRELLHGKVVNENKVKYTIVGEHCMVGYTGTVDIINSVLQRAVEITKEWGLTQKALTVTDYSFICQKIITSSSDFISRYDTPTINLLFMGVENNKIVLKALGTDNNYNIVDCSPFGNRLTNCSLLSPEASTAKSFEEFYDTTVDLVGNMDNYIRYIASIDGSVNTNISTIVLDMKKVKSKI